MRAEIEAERDRKDEAPVVARVTPRPGAGPRRDVAVPSPTVLGRSPRRRPTCATVWQYLDRNTLFRHHWGGHRAKGEEYERIIREVFEPELATLSRGRAARWLARAIDRLGLFPVQRRRASSSIVFDPERPEP